MRIKPTLPQDFFDKGFTAETDPFSLKEMAEGLTRVFDCLEHGTVSILDGRWGSGKSVFALQWKTHLRNSGLPAIYFDAFASDYIDDPFQAISTSLIRAAKDAKQANSPEYQRFLRATARAGKRIGSTAAKLTAKVVTLGAIGAAEIEDLSALKDELASGVAEVSDIAVAAMLEKQAGAEAAFQELRQSLLALPKLLGDTGEGEDDKKGKNLVVIIDELDRCRPDFALGVLETLKHFFRADGIHFVLVTHMDYLVQSVRSKYLLEDKSAEYLEKFYDFVIHFEEKRERHQGPRSKTYLTILISQILRTLPAGPVPPQLQEHMQAITIAYNLSLRQVENFVTNVALAFQYLRRDGFAPDVIVSHLCILKTLSPALYQKAKMGTLSYSEFSKFLSKGDWPETYLSDRVAQTFQYYLDPDIDLNSEDWRGFGSGLFGYNFRTLQDVIPYICASAVDRFSR